MYENLVSNITLICSFNSVINSKSSWFLGQRVLKTDHNFTLRHTSITPLSSSLMNKGSIVTGLYEVADSYDG